MLYLRLLRCSMYKDHKLTFCHKKIIYELMPNMNMLFIPQTCKYKHYEVSKETWTYNVEI